MPHITYVATPGLANRLRALAGYYALAQIQGLDLYVDWVENPACDAPFDNLFAPLNFNGIQIGHGSNSTDPAAYYDDSPALISIWERYGQTLSTEEDFACIALRLLRSLQPAAALKVRLERYSQELQIQDRIGMHIRMTDNLILYGGGSTGFDQSKVSKLKGFQAYLSKLETEGKPVFLATDNASIESQLTTRYKNVASLTKNYDMSKYEDYHRRANFDGRVGLLSRIAARILRLINFPDKHLGWLPQNPGKLRTTSMEDAVIDLFLLSRCGSVVSTYWSSFGLMAALMGKRTCMVMHGYKANPAKSILRWNSFHNF